MSYALIIGHSFVKRCQRYVIQSKSSMFQLNQYSHVYFHGVGGAKVRTMDNEMDIIAHLDVKCVILDIGSNDIGDIQVSTWDIAHDILRLAHEIVHKYGAKVVIMPQFKRVKVTSSLNKHGFNARVDDLNAHLRYLCKQSPNPNITYHVLRNMWPIWDTLICKDGVHLTNNGMYRLCRNYRGALVRAYPA